MMIALALMSLEDKAGTLYAEVPNRIGTASMNEKRAACGRLRPQSKPAPMVDPDRDIPGRIAAAWAHPIAKAFGRVTAVARAGIEEIVASSELG